MVTVLPYPILRRMQTNTKGQVSNLFILDKDVSKERRVHEALKNKTAELRGRVKELNCLYGISNLVEKQEISLEEIMQGIVDLLPEAWQYPEITGARIMMKGREFQSDNFLPTKWIQTAAMKVDGESDATIEVCYLEKKHELDDGPFLKEKKALLLDELLGKKEFVINNIGETFKKVKGLAGSAILADGKVGLILDMSGLFQAAVEIS